MGLNYNVMLISQLYILCAKYNKTPLTMGFLSSTFLVDAKDNNTSKSIIVFKQELKNKGEK